MSQLRQLTKCQRALQVTRTLLAEIKVPRLLRSRFGSVRLPRIRAASPQLRAASAKELK